MNKKIQKKLEQKFLDSAQDLLDYSGVSKEELYELIKYGCTEVGETNPTERR